MKEKVFNAIQTNQVLKKAPKKEIGWKVLNWEKCPFFFMHYDVSKEFKCQNMRLYLQYSIDLNNLHILKLCLT